MWSFEVAYYYRLLRDTLPFPLLVLEHLCISLEFLQGNTLAFDKDIKLTSACYRSQGIALLPTSGTPTPNGLRSSWELLLRRSSDMLVGPSISTFMVLEGGPDDKMSPQSVFWISAHSLWLTLELILRQDCLMDVILKCLEISLMTCHVTHMMVKVEQLFLVTELPSWDYVKGIKSMRIIFLACCSHSYSEGMHCNGVSHSPQPPFTLMIRWSES